MSFRPKKRRRVSNEENEHASNDRIEQDFSSDLDSDVTGSESDEGQNGSTEASTASNQSNPAQLNGRDQSKQRRNTNRNSSGKRNDDSELQNGPMDAFRLQVRELLRSSDPKYSSLDGQVSDLLDNVRKAILASKAVGPLPLKEARKCLAKPTKTRIPFPNPQPMLEANHQYSFDTPTAVLLSGAYSLRTLSKADERLWIDVVVHMPAAVLAAKDYQDYRYFHKRAFYLAKLTHELKSTLRGSVKLKYAHLDDNPLLPVLFVETMSQVEHAETKSFPRFGLRIIPCADKSLIPIEKLTSQAHNVRALRPQPSPFHNASLAEDHARIRMHQLQLEAAEQCSGYRDACKLGQIWLRQRGFSSSMSGTGFGANEWSMLIALLLKEGPSTRHASFMPTFDGVQLFKATIQILALNDMVQKPLKLGHTETSGLAQDGHPAIYSDNLRFNLLYRMSAWAYQRLKQDAHATLRALNRDVSDAFETCFIYKVDEVFFRSDYFINLSFDNLQIEGLDSTDSPAALAKAERLYSVLTRGLTDRVSSIYITPPPTETESIEESKAHGEKRTSSASVALTVDPANVSRKVDRGPTDEEADRVAEFRKLWGDKAELRRFNDGSIREAVAWTKDQPRALLEDIMAQLIHKHFGSSAGKGLEVRGNDFASIYKPSDLPLSRFDPVMDAFSSLESDIRALDDLPLQIRQMKPADSALSFSSVDVPTRTSHSKPINIIIQFEGSGRWPDDLAAIQMTKVAFLLKMAESLRSVAGRDDINIGLENEHSEILNRAFLAVHVSSSLVFHIRIHHEREQSLIERQLRDRSAAPSDREISAAALASYQKTFERRSAHVGAMQILVRRHPALSATARLLKSWFNAHLLSTHISEELIETIAARAFTSPYPWPVPTTAMTGFLRSLLFLSRWDWQHQPLIVDFNGSLGKDSLEIIHTRLKAWRQIDPAMNRVVLFAATNFDTDGTTWSEYSPSKVVASRMTNLAKAATSMALKDGADLDSDRLFKASMKDYDFLIYLQDDADDTQGFFEDLKATYSAAAVFFADFDTAKAIAGIWQRDIGARNFKASLPFSSTPLERSGDNKSTAAINKDAIFAEIGALGGNLIRSMTLKN